MTPEEFNDWRRDLAGKFPSLAEWFKKLTPASQVAQRDVWRTVLADVSLRDAIAANMAIATGQAEAIGHAHNDRERVAVHIRRVARDIAASRNADKEQREGDRAIFAARRRARRTSRGLDGIADDVALLVRLAESGHTMREASEHIRAKRADDARDAVRCVDCRDVGIVHVWHVNMMHAFREDRLDDAHPYTAAVPCHCEAGDRYVWGKATPPPRGHWTQGDRYSSERWCRVTGDWREPEVYAEFKAWCECYFDDLDRRTAARLVDEPETEPGKLF